MSGKVAVTRTIRYVTTAKSPVNVVVSPPEVIFRAGTQARIYVNVNAYRGDTQLEYDNGNDTYTCSMLGTSIGNITDNLAWSFDSGSNINSRFSYVLIYKGQGNIDRNISFTVTLSDGTVLSRSIHVMTVADGAKGDSGPFVPPPMVWGKYHDGYIFQDGVTYTDSTGSEYPATRLDVVLREGTVNGQTGFIAYRCIQSHKKDSSNTALLPEAKNSQYWQMMDAGTFKLLATEVLLADNAYIGLMSSNGIRIYDKNGSTVGEISGTTDRDNSHIIWMGGTSGSPLWGVDGYGCHRFGGVSGQRVELDPSPEKGAQTRFFDKSGREVVTICGSECTVGSLYETGGISVKGSWPDSATRSYSSSGHNGAEQGVWLGEANVGKQSGSLVSSLNVSFQIRGRYVTGGTSGTSGPIISSARAVLRILKYENGLWPLYDYSEITTGSAESQLRRELLQSMSTTMQTRSMVGTLHLDTHLTEGRYGLQVIFVMNDGTVSSTESLSSDLTVNSYSSDFKAGSSPRAILGASGLIVARSSTEYLSAGSDGNGFNVEMRSEDYGIKLTNKGISLFTGSDGQWHGLSVEKIKNLLI